MRDETRPQVLVIDDHATTRTLLRGALEEAGYLVEEARDSQGALAIAQRKRPRVALLDVGFPEGEGIALAGRLRALAEREPLALLGLCDFPALDDMASVWSAGLDDVLLKPVDRAQLLTCIEGHLHGERARARLVREARVERVSGVVVGGRLATTEAASTSAVARELSLRSAFRAAELAVVNGFAEAMLTHADVEQALVAALSTCFDASGCTIGALYLCDRYQQLRMRPLGAFSAEELRELTRFYGMESELRELMVHGEPRSFLAHDEDEAPLAQLATRMRAVHGMVVPLMERGRSFGALLLAVRPGQRAVDFPALAEFARAIAVQVARGLALSDVLREREVAEREAEQQRRLAREQAAVFRALVQCAPDLVVQLDRSGAVRFVNRTPESVYGSSESSYFAWLPPAFRAEARATFDAVLRDGTARSFESAWEDASGRTFHHESHMGPVRSGDEIVGAVVVQRDVSHKRKVEADLLVIDRMGSLGALASGVVHELNNPLASVMANLDVALHRLQSAPASRDELLEELRDARSGVDRLRAVVGDLRLFASTRPEQHGPVEVDKVLDAALRLAGARLRRHARVVRAYESVPVVEAHAASLGHAFLTLFVQVAEELAERGGSQRELRVELTSDGRSRVLVRIGDGDATRLPASSLRPPSSSLPPQAGSALGLAMCHRIVRSLGGTMLAHADAEHGVSVQLSLPTRSAARESAKPAPPTGRRAKILSVDDDQLLTQLVEQTLADVHDVTRVHNGEEALQRLHVGERFDAILCSVLDRDSSSMQLHRELLRTYPAQAERVVFVTAPKLTREAEQFLNQMGNLRLDSASASERLAEHIERLVR